MRIISGDANTDEVNVGMSKSKVIASTSLLDEYILGQFILCRYETEQWVGNIKEISFENEDVLVSFMHPKVPSRNFHWPTREDLCWVPTQHITTSINPPSISKTGRVYQLTPSDEHHNIE